MVERWAGWLGIRLEEGLILIFFTPHIISPGNTNEKKRNEVKFTQHSVLWKFWWAISWKIRHPKVKMGQRRGFSHWCMCFFLALFRSVAFSSPCFWSSLFLIRIAQITEVIFLKTLNTKSIIVIHSGKNWTEAPNWAAHQNSIYKLYQLGDAFRPQTIRPRHLSSFPFSGFSDGVSGS